MARRWFADMNFLANAPYIHLMTMIAKCNLLELAFAYYVYEQMSGCGLWILVLTFGFGFWFVLIS